MQEFTISCSTPLVADDTLQYALVAMTLFLSILFMHLRHVYRNYSLQIGALLSSCAFVGAMGLWLVGTFDHSVDYRNADVQKWFFQRTTQNIHAAAQVFADFYQQRGHFGAGLSYSQVKIDDQLLPWGQAIQRAGRDVRKDAGGQLLRFQRTHGQHFVLKSSGCDRSWDSDDDIVFDSEANELKHNAQVAKMDSLIPF